MADYYPEDKKVQLFIVGGTLIFVFVPVLTTIVVYALILRIVCRSNQFGHSRTSSQAIKTTLLVVGIYLLAAMPFIAGRLYVLATAAELPLRFRMFSTVIYTVNTAVNPYVYIVTNQSLRKHGRQTFGKSKRTNGLDASSVTLDPQSRAWAVTRAIKNVSSIKRLDTGRSKNKLVLRTLTSSNSQVHSVVEEENLPNPTNDTSDENLKAVSEVIHNESALEDLSTGSDNVMADDCSTGHQIRQASTTELVSDKVE